jgi:hypothetical protein
VTYQDTFLSGLTASRPRCRSDPAIINSSSAGNRDIVFRSPKILDHAAPSAVGSGAASAGPRLVVNRGRRTQKGAPLPEDGQYDESWMERVGVRWSGNRSPGTWDVLRPRRGVVELRRVVAVTPHSHSYVKMVNRMVELKGRLSLRCLKSGNSVACLDFLNCTLGS